MKERWRRKDSGKEERKEFLRERGVQEGEEVEYKELKERDKRRQEEKRGKNGKIEV